MTRATQITPVTPTSPDPDRRAATSRRIQQLCIWCGPLAMLLFTVGMITAGFVRPPNPAAHPLQIAEMITGNRTGIRVGLVIVMLGGVTTAFFVAAITEQMKRVEGTRTPLANAQLGTGMVGILLFILPMMAVQTAAFRPELDPTTMQTLDDLGWITLVGVWALASAQCVAIAVCAFTDTQSIVFPRWVGYFNIWVALIFVPDSALYFFTTGPLSWNGVFVWWLPVVAFISWFLVMFVVIGKAIRSESDASLRGDPMTSTVDSTRLDASA